MPTIAKLRKDLGGRDIKKKKQLYKQWYAKQSASSKALLTANLNLGEINRHSKAQVVRFYNEAVVPELKVKKIAKKFDSKRKSVDFSTQTKTYKAAGLVGSNIYTTQNEAFIDDVRDVIEISNHKSLKKKGLMNIIKNQFIKSVQLSKTYRTSQRNYTLKYQFGFSFEVTDDDGDNTISYTVHVHQRGNLLDALSLLVDAIIKKAQEYGGLFLTNILFETRMVDATVGQGNSRSIAAANKKWDIIDSKVVEKNCLYQSICLARNPEKAQEYIDDAVSRGNKLIDVAKHLKHRVKPTNTECSDYDTVQEVADYMKTPIQLYNNIYQATKLFTPKKTCTSNPKKPLELSLQFNHFVALLPKGSLKAATNQPTVIKKEPNMSLKPIHQNKIKDDIVVDKQIFVWDLECAPDDKNIQTAYAAGIAYYTLNREMICERFWGRDCLKQMFHHIVEADLLGRTAYAHNSAKYDTLILMREFLLENTQFVIDGKKSVCSDGRWLRLNVYDTANKKRPIIFQDSCALLAMGLEKACKEFGVVHQKLTETVKHSEITLDNYHTFPQLDSYLKHDCLGLLEVMDTFIDVAFEASNRKVNLTSCLTSATFAKKSFNANHYDPRNYPIFQPDDKDDEFIRNSYFGGRNECFVKVGSVVSDVHYLDFTSLYPSACVNDLPYNMATYVNDVKVIKQKNFYGFIRCMVRSTDFKRKPIHGLKSNHKLIFPYFENWTEITLFSEEIKLGLRENMYEYKYIDAVMYSKAPILKSAMKEAFARKANAKKQGKDGLALTYKIIANSTYGFWALNTKNREQIMIGEHNKIDVLKYVNDDSLLNISQTENYTTLKVCADISVRDTSIGIAAAITSWSRMRLWKLMDAIESKGHQVYYCDTDSVMTSCDITDYDDLMAEFCWDGTGDELGSLKNEADDEIKKLYTKRLMKHEKYKNQGCSCSECGKKPFTGLDAEDKGKLKNLFIKNGKKSFDRLILGGLKFYSLQTTLEDGSVVEINKLKGGSARDLCHKNFSEETAFKQDITQFRCGVSQYMSETEPYAIRVTQVPKNFEFQYCKASEVKNTVMLQPLVY